MLPPNLLHQQQFHQPQSHYHSSKFDSGDALEILNYTLDPVIVIMSNNAECSNFNRTQISTR